MNIPKNVLNAIEKMSSDELRELNTVIVDTVNSRRRLKNINAKRAFSVGDQVAFNTRNGEFVSGIVSKINKVNIKVKTGSATWTVSPNLLNKV